MHSGFMFLPKEQLTRMIEDRLVDREDDTLFVVAISSLMRKIEGALHKGL